MTNAQPAAAQPSPTAAAPKGRVRKIFDLSQVFSEVPEIANSAARSFYGFQDPGPGVPEVNPSFIQEREFLEEFTAFLATPLYVLTLFGPTGCGKSERVLNFFGRLNTPVFQVSCTADTRAYDLIGDMQLVAGETKFVPKALYRGMKFGYPVLLDEAMRLSPRITSKFHTIRDRGELYVEETGETLKAAKGFRMILTANQAGLGDASGFYPGDEVQDAAWLNGSPVIECGYPAPEIEERIVRDALVRAHPAFGTEPELQRFPAAMVSVANRCRSLFVGNTSNSATSDRIEVPFSTRHLVWWADFFVKFRGTTAGIHPLYKALDFVLLRRACPGTRAAVEGFIEAEFAIARTDQ